MNREDVERIVREAHKSNESPNLRNADLKNASLPHAELRHADLSYADLRGVDLRSANLKGANLKGANLKGANLWCAKLGRANLRGADLKGAALRDVDLSEADLRGADLTGAYLTGADLTDAVLPDGVPVVPGIDAAILEAIESGGRLDMGRWHSCETTHCRAGWAVVLAGDAGRALEQEIGTDAAGALIYAASGSHPTPNWFAKNDAAMADMRDRAGYGRFCASPSPRNRLPGPGDPDPAPFLKAIRKELDETKKHHMPGPRSLADIGTMLGVSYSGLRARLNGKRPLEWELAHRIAAAVGVAPPSTIGDASLEKPHGTPDNGEEP